VKFGDAMRLAQSQDWIKPRYHEYLKGPRDVAGEQKFTAQLLAKPERDRTQSWAASGAGTCLRARQFSYLGLTQKKPDDHAQNIFLNGHWVHMRHQVVGLTAGYLKEAEVPLRHKAFNLVGTMDAIDTTDTPVEYKSINQNGYGTVRAFGVKTEHKYQVHSYMLAGGFKGARVVYENKNTNDILEFYVERDSEIIMQIQDELIELNLATQNEHLLPMLEECKRKEGKYRWCPYASQCPTAGREMSWAEIPVRSVTLPMSSSASDSPTSRSPQASLRITGSSSTNSRATGTSSSAG
jgi:hypothetical protein